MDESEDEARQAEADAIQILISRGETTELLGLGKRPLDAVPPLVDLLPLVLPGPVILAIAPVRDNRQGVEGVPSDCAGCWESIDLLHVDTDPHTEEQTLRWFDLYASRCRVIALHDAHHPSFGVGRAVREYWGNPSGWTVLTRT